MDASEEPPQETKRPENSAIPPRGDPTPPPQPTAPPPPPVISPEVAPPAVSQPPVTPPQETIEAELTEFDRLTLRWSRLNVIVLAATLIVILGTAVVFWDQFQEMAVQTDLLGIGARQARRDSADASLTTAKQLKVAQQQAEAAQSSVEAIQAQMRQDQRPLVRVEGNFPKGKEAHVGDGVQGQVTLQNIGKTPALNIAGKWVVKMLPNVQRTIRFPYAPRTWWGMTTGVMYANDPPNDQPAYWIADDWNGDGTPTMRKLTPAEIIDLAKGKSFYIIYGTVDYSDEFGVRHWTRFCTWTPLNKTVSYWAKDCTAYNAVDHNR